MKFGLREAIFTVLLLAIPAGAWWLVFRPSNARNQEMLAQIEVKREKLSQLNEATATMGDLRDQIARLEKTLEFLDSRLPSEKEIDKILQGIWKLAESNDLRTESIRTLVWKPQDAFTTEGAPQAELPIEVRLAGDFMGFYAFLQAMEQQPRITRVRKMKLEQPKKGAPGEVAATFEMSIFFERAGRQWQ